MQVINELVIRGPSPDVTAFLQRLETNLDGGWRRNHELEERLAARGLTASAYCFSCDETPDRPAAALWLHARTPEEWSVFSVVPLNGRSLSQEECNRLLTEFESRFLEPQSRGTDVRPSLLPTRPQLNLYLSSDAEQLLRSFLTTADHRYWQEFLLSAHREESMLDVPFLEEWLADEGCSSEVQKKLGREYENARRLLWQYDQERKR